MNVIGLYGDEAIKQFHSNQHVNVWDVMMRAFHCDASMDSLPEEVLEDPESYFLEPTTEDGQPISLKEACAASSN
jgi:hypothetical protein